MFSGLILGLAILASALMIVRLQDVRSRELFADIRKNYTFNATSFKTLHVDDIWECALMCLRASFCFYFNYQVSMERSALCQLILRLYVRRDQLGGFLVNTTGFAFGQVTSKGPSSCLDYMQMGETKNGVYEVQDKSLHSYNVFCDFTSEPSSAWTLVHSKLSSTMITPRGPEFSINKPVNEANPNWKAYRLPLDKMEALRSVSTHWRITCNFPVDGVDYRDYARAKFLDVDMISFIGHGICKATEFINIRGYNYTNRMVPWWQFENWLFHTDSSLFHKQCPAVENVPGSLISEDNFGVYDVINNQFRCTRDSKSTTNHWFGGYV